MINLTDAAYMAVLFAQRAPGPLALLHLAARRRG
jgi:hypothetical protein